jgi:dolichyl-phosphate-mannose--protein O-mannosyl transferase
MTAVGVEVATTPPRRDVLERVATAWTRADTIALSAITIAAGAIRWFRVTAVSNMVFDEAYYASRACEYVFGQDAPRECALDGLDPVHPPLGTWMIAIGIRIFGFRSGGWRLASLAAGTLAVMALYLLARKLLRSTVAAAVASGALALDFLHFVHSRIAMLDIFVVLFGLAAFLFAVYDRDRTIVVGLEERSRTWGHRLAERRWRLLAGVAAGAAVASKWSGFGFLAAVIILTFVWEWSKRSGALGRRLGRTVVEEGPSILIALAVVPLLVYIGSYAGRLEGALLAWPWSQGSWGRAFIAAQRDMLSFHLGLDTPHIYGSAPWSWPLLKRPIAYDVEVIGGRYREIMAFGNPLAWWPALVALGWVAVRWVRRRRTNGEGVILAGFAASWLPWLLLAPARGTSFLFYLLPAVPFLCLALGYVAGSVERARLGRVAIGSYAGVVLASFVFFYPVLAAVPISEDAWRARILFEDCALEGVTLSGIELPEGASPPPDTPGPYPEASMRGGPPPDGWCWI